MGYGLEVFKMGSPEEIKITEKDVMDMMDLFTRVPPVILNMAVNKNLNAVKSFESQIETYYSQMSDGKRVKIGKVLEMPVPELQEILGKAYEKTHQKQLKILADPRAERFIAGNLEELKKLLFL
jgi:hypothetical protein